jgi:hypothetical protein
VAAAAAAQGRGVAGGVRCGPCRCCYQYTITTATITSITITTITITITFIVET